MRLSEHIRHCQEILASDGDIDVLVWQTRADDEIKDGRGDCKVKYGSTLAGEPSVDVIKHPAGGTARVAMISQ
jgi:hypothetical protein